MSPLLLIGSTVALALLVVHSWRTRGRAVTLAFFAAALAFGFLRGNVIWLLCWALGSGEDVLMPYVPQGGLVGDMGHVSLQVALGWVFSLYLAWTVSELILKRLPRFAGRVFMTASLASLVMVAICWCMETTAVAVGWWYWSLPTRTTLFGNVNVWAMEGWFSVIPDFLVPFLVIACAEKKVPSTFCAKHPKGAYRQKVLGTFFSARWLWLLAFPLHVLGHLSCRWFPYAIFVYSAMELLVVSLAMFSGLRMTRGELSEPPGRRNRSRTLNGVRGPGPISSSALLGAALAIFFGVMVVANVLGGVDAAGQFTLVPLMLLCLLAWRRVPAWVVGALSLAALGGWYWAGPRALWALAPIGVWGFLRLLDRLRAPLILRLVPPAATVALTVWALVLYDADRTRARDYAAAWVEGDRLAFGRQPEAAPAAYRRADSLRPRDAILLYETLQRMTDVGGLEVHEAARLYWHRLPRVVRELEEVVNRDPDGAQPRMTLARFHLFLGKVSDATDQYRALARRRPRDPRILAQLGYLLLRQGDVRGAEAPSVRAVGLSGAPVEATVNLGVIRFLDGKDDEARALWEQALARSPGNPVARLNLERLRARPVSRNVDPRLLAQPEADHDVAVWVMTLAGAADTLIPSERLRLLLEAVQLDPDYLLPHMSLVNVYLGRSGLVPDRGRALWHARRAVEIAEMSGDAARREECRALLERALQANGGP